MDDRPGGVAAIGAPALIQGYGLAGVRLLPACGDEAVRAALRSLADDEQIVILTADAARVPVSDDRMWLVLPADGTP